MIELFILRLMAFYDDWWAWLVEKGSPIIQFIVAHPYHFGIGAAIAVAIPVIYKGVKRYKSGPSVSQEDIEARMAQIRKNLDEEQ